MLCFILCEIQEICCVFYSYSLYGDLYTYCIPIQCSGIYLIPQNTHKRRAKYSQTYLRSTINEDVIDFVVFEECLYLILHARTTRMHMHALYM